jgi:4-amino-4-deoxy-L-arabinose transferase-like glycosyltransferase
VRRRLALIAAAMLIAALAIRVIRIEDSAYYRPVNDAGSYLTLASQIARTGDYTTSRRPGVGAGGTQGPSAYFPPGYPYLLAAVDLIDGHTARRGAAIQGARISQAVLGTVVVALTGLVALEALGGPAPALIALALAAVYPVLVELSSILVAENLLTALILAALWATLRARRAARPYRWIAAAGILAGLAALTHENGILLALPLAFGLWRLRRPGRSAAAPAVLIIAALVTIAPWTIRNAVLLHRFVPISDEAGITLVGTYNPASAANRVVPYKWRIFYGIPGERALTAGSARMTEPALGGRLQQQALDYIGRHPLSPIVVAYHNTLRLLELEGSYAWHASAYAMGLRPDIAGTGVVSFWIMCALAIVGALTRTARAAPRFIWALPLLFALSVVLVNVETPRFREPVEPFLILLAASAVTTAARALSTRLGGTPIRRDGGPAVAARDAQLVEMNQRLT